MAFDHTRDTFFVRERSLLPEVVRTSTRLGKLIKFWYDQQKGWVGLIQGDDTILFSRVLTGMGFDNGDIYEHTERLVYGGAKVEYNTETK